MLSSAFKIATLPGRFTLNALTSIASPSSVNALSTAIAQASIETAASESQINVEGLNVNIELNDSRLLTTAGFSTAMALGTVYWIGQKLNLQFRYAEMIKALESLKSALAIGDNVAADQALRLVDNLSNPLIDPVTLQPLDSSDEVKAIYETLFNKPAKSGSMFNASTFTSAIDDVVKTSSKTGIAIAIGQTDEALEAMIKKARPIAGKAVGRLVGGILWVDTVWWLATSVIDLGLNFIGIDEENQRIPILSDIPIIGSLFDLSDSTGSSIVDIALTPLLDGIFSLFSLEDEVQTLTNSLWSIIMSAALSPSLLPFTIALLDFYVESVSIEIQVPATFNISETKTDLSFDVFGIRPEPLDILVAWLYLITGKIVFKAWIRPAFNLLASRITSSTS
tara:strand:+ start:9223 stop:10407 length:1185 start_codon:yes stop_codon:yes gene_type:complete